MNLSSPARPHFHAGPNNPGIVAATTRTFATFSEASDFQIEEMYWHADCVAAGVDVNDRGVTVETVPWRDWRTLTFHLDDLILCDVAEELRSERGPSWDEEVAGRIYWIAPCDEGGCSCDASFPGLVAAS